MAQGTVSRWRTRLAIDRPAALAWATYDWANSAFMTTIMAAVFPAYFARFAAAELDREVSSQRYSLATTLALAAIAVASPLLGAMADVRASRKRWLIAFAGLGIAATGALFLVQRGDWLLGLVLFGLANCGAAGSVGFYDALLPHVAREGEIDRLSATGFALGYVGGGLLLALNVAWIAQPAAFGLSTADETLPWRLSFLSVAIWWAVFTIPLALRVPEPPRAFEPDESAGQAALRTSLARLKETLRELRRYREAFLMLLAFLLYNDGIATVMRMAVVFASARGIDDAVLIATILAVQFVGMPFAILFGQLARRIAPKRLVLVALAVYAAISMGSFWMSSAWHFVALGLAVATVQGGSQALSRSLFARMVPRHKSGEFFALFGVGEKFAGVLGPLAFYLVSRWTGDSRWAIVSIVVFFALGAWLLTRVDVEAGERTARASDAVTSHSK
jgi:UMF1 family MFS transporter